VQDSGIKKMTTLKNIVPDKLIANEFKANIFSLNQRSPFRFKEKSIPEWFRKASVLILFWEEKSAVKVVMTKRSVNLDKHRGEVCFPGGRINKDESFVHAALREAEEEIGIDKNRVEVIGRLSDAWSGAAFHLIPIVGWYRGIPEFNRNPAEVQEILIFDLIELIYNYQHYDKLVEKNGVMFHNSFIESPKGTVFGLSADILLEAIEIGLQNKSLRGPDRSISLQHALDNGFFNQKLDCFRPLP
jgi:8-oxo-dGTP pyrophosphatase MutT (NUDIX family)